MRLFQCPNCSTEIYFDNLVCLNCGTLIAYDVGADEFVVDALWCALRSSVESCNWIAATADGWCRSCALDTDHFATERREPFQRAKRRALYQLIRMGVDLGREPTLRFELQEGSAESPVTIGHADGLITLDTAEGDPARREAVRTSLGEPYRSPLGHVRHELGHWYWQAHIDREFSTEEFRAVFGDESESYADALERHYANGDDGSWQGSFISFYASMHPWEDFAETFAHILHLSGTLETAAAHGISAARGAGAADFATMYASWTAVSVVLNELNRSMGATDAYPFAPPPPAVSKLEFVWGAVRRGLAAEPAPAEQTPAEQTPAEQTRRAGPGAAGRSGAGLVHRPAGHADRSSPLAAQERLTSRGPFRSHLRCPPR